MLTSFPAMRHLSHLPSKCSSSRSIFLHLISPAICSLRFPSYLLYRHNSTTSASETSSSLLKSRTEAQVLHLESNLNHARNTPSNGLREEDKTIIVKTVPAPHLGHIRILSLNSPRNRNALSRQMVRELTGELIYTREQLYRATEIELDKMVPYQDFPRVLILASEVDGTFCAGADLKERISMTRDETNEYLAALRIAFRIISEFPIPTISAVASYALGGGLELALATNLRIFANTARVGLPETRLGIMPGAGGTYRLRDLIGESRALDMILTGRTITGSTAHSMNICNRLVDTDSRDEVKTVPANEMLLEKALEYAMEICEGAPTATRIAFKVVRQGTMESETRHYGHLLHSADRDEGLKAFAEKRKPVFRGEFGGPGSLEKERGSRRQTRSHRGTESANVDIPEEHT